MPTSSPKYRYTVLIVACFCLYVFCIAAKSIYTVEIVEIIKHYGTTKQVAGVATLMSFITYAGMQLVFAKLAKKLNIPLFIVISSFVGALAYGLFPFCGNIYQIWVLSAFGGAFTASIYPACMAVIEKYLPSSMFLRANMVMSLGFSVSFALDYLCGSFFVSIDAWELGFWVFAFLFLLAALFFYGAVKLCRRYTVDEEAKSDTRVSEGVRTLEHKWDKKIVVFIIFTGLLGFWSNFIYYGIANWMTSLLHEVFALSSSVAIFLTLLVPLLAYAGSLLEIWFCRRFSFWTVSAAFSMVAVISTLLLAFSFSFRVWLTLLLSLIAIIFIRAIASLAAFEIPLKSVHLMNAGKLGAIINTFSAVGAAIASPIFGKVIDSGGYMIYYALLSLMGVIMLLIAAFGKKTNA